MSTLVEGLNPEQTNAVLHDEGPLVVFAGAGSGKTRVITHRIARLVLERQVPPWRILAVTFTNKAAGEMRSRLQGLLAEADDVSARDLWVGTFHAVCARLLRRFHEEVGVRRDFTIYDDTDQKSAIVRILRDLRLDDKRFPPKGVASQINKAKQEVVGPDQFDTSGNPWLERVRDIYEQYEARLSQAGALDFGDLIYKMVRAVESSSELRNHLASRFEYVLVDEFQDTNHAQYRLLKSILGEKNNLCVVGDDDQSIYRWRGADRRNILDFRDQFPAATLIKLEQNYRSTRNILDTAYAVISRNLAREPKQLWTENEGGTQVVVVQCEDERDEASALVRRIETFLADGRSREDVALFYRTHAQSRVLEEALRNANLPYRVVGGTRFYDRAEVKDVLAYLRVIHNPDDDVSLLRIINSPTRGIGKSTLEKLLDQAAQSGGGIWKSLESLDGVDSLSRAAKTRLEAFRELIRGLATGHAPHELRLLTESILEETGYLRILQQQGTVESDSRINNIEEFVSSVQEFEEDAESPSLESFLELVTLQTTADESTDQDLLTLMTVHAAKGLEFPVVFVAGLEDGMFPLRGLEAYEDPEELEEERRLAYVAFTRAEEELILSHAQIRRVYGQLKMQRPSSFLQGLPAHAVRAERTAPRRSSAAPMLQGRVGFHGAGPKLAWSATRAPAARPERSPFPSSGESYVNPAEGGDQIPVHVGMTVRHAKFGNGTVRSLPSGVPPRMRVQFPGWGEKTVVAEYLELG